MRLQSMDIGDDLFLLRVSVQRKGYSSLLLTNLEFEGGSC